MSGEPQLISSSVTLGIGGVHLRIEAIEPDLHIRIGFPGTRFVVKKNVRADSVLSVQLGDPDPGGPPAFASGGAWELYPSTHGGDRLAIWTALNGGGREPMLKVDFSKDLDRGQMTVHPRYAPGRIASIGYPLNEYLSARLLARRGATILHASCVADQDTSTTNAYVFAGHSGAGKSTISSIAEQRGFRILSDDRTVLSVEKGVVLASGTPWHGSYKCGVPDTVPVRALFLLEQAGEDEIVPISESTAFSEILVRTVRPFVQREEQLAVIETISYIVRSVPCAILRFRPTANALNVIRQFVSS